ncbi:MAG: restriction endonuclease subunit S [Rhodococcus sp. (in: high G+C Gram-positive bacteria)]|uniref:restriction endonuclease subunit S n=1 Tax=Rhodococcus sp. TaxID=1831 RepID=UPI003BB5CD2E
MNWPAYAHYVESNVPWLGALPAHWATPHLGHITDCLDAVRIPLNAAERAEVPGDVPYWGANGVVGSVDRPLVDGELVLLGEDGAPFTDRTREKAFFVNEPIWPNNHIHVLRPSCGLHPKFLTHALNATDYSWFIEGSTREKLTQGNMSSIPIALPPTTEQRAIVDFLDRETAKIDALIAKQEQLVATLREDRSATITQAVTKGLNSNVEMKDTEVQWMGSVPIHWLVDRIKNSVESARNGIWGSEPDGGVDDIRCVRVADFDRPQLAIHDHDVTLRKVTKSERDGRILQNGDLILEKSGGGDKNPVGFVVLYEAEEPAVCSNFVARVRLARGQCPKFWTYVHHCLYQSRLTFPSIKQNTGIQNLDQQSYFNERVAFPPLDEQEQIVGFLDAQCSRVDSLIAKSNEMIATLREYRSTLITDAVTGKIDVRGVA